MLFILFEQIKNRVIFKPSFIYFYSNFTRTTTILKKVFQKIKQDQFLWSIAQHTTLVEQGDVKYEEKQGVDCVRIVVNCFRTTVVRFVGRYNMKV